MRTLSFNRTDLPLWWLEGDGSIDVQVPASVADLNAPLDPKDGQLLKTGFSVSGSRPLRFGSSTGAALGIEADTRAELRAWWSSAAAPDVLANHGLDKYFESHSGDLLLGLQLGAAVDASLGATVTYAPLTAKATVNTGADAGYTFLRAFPAGTPLVALLRDFFNDMRMPASLTTPLLYGQVIAFEYGGYLNFGASLSAGFEMKGSHSFEAGQLKLSEHYRFSALGSLGVRAGVAGRFAVEVRGLADPARKDWVRLIVRRKNSKEVGVAADVAVDFANKLEGLPESSDEFLGALLGVNAKNWLNFLAALEKCKTIEDFEAAADTLSRDYIARLVGMGFDQICGNLEPALAIVRKTVAEYKNLDNRAIALFDRYYDRVESTLAAQLKKILSAASWNELKNDGSSEVTDVLDKLTDGDTLSYMLGLVAENGLQLVQERAKDLLDRIQAGAHAQIVRAIALAKEEFGLNKLFDGLGQIENEAKLKQLAAGKLGGFASRLIGRALTGLKKDKDFQEALQQIGGILAHRSKFQESLYAKFTQAVNETLRLRLHAEYSKTDERQALIDAELNLATQAGKDLLAAAASGDVTRLLADYRPDAVRINEGVLTHRVAKQTSLMVNVVGWHKNWSYSGFHRVIVNSEQQIKTEANGSLTVHTKLELNKEKERRSGLKGSEERVYTNFLLQLWTMNAGVAEFDEETKTYLVEAIQGMSAKYRLSFSDQKTTLDELRYYLQFAQDFGLTQPEAGFDQIERLMPRVGSHYGPVAVDYHVRFLPAGLEAAFQKPLAEDRLRLIMRRMVLANYVAEGGGLADIGWCYWTPGIRASWKQGQAQFVNRLSDAEFKIEPAPFLPLPSPGRVSVSPQQLHVLSTLYYIEDRFVEALTGLQKLLAAPAGKRRLELYEEALGDFGDALKKFDDFDAGVNTVFALIDQVIREHMDAAAARGSSMEIQSTAGERPVRKVLFSPSAAQAGLAQAERAGSPAP